MTRNVLNADYLRGFLDHLDNVPDHRATDNRRYTLQEILFLTIVGIAAGCHSWEDIEEFCKSKIEFLRQYIPYKTIPSDDTLRRFFRFLDRKALSSILSGWIKDVFPSEMEDVVAIDGKTLRGSKTPHNIALHTISAYVTSTGITLAQLEVGTKQNEISMAPQLIEMIGIRGSIVTMDAMLCQANIIELIVDKQADYLVGLKKNQCNIYQDAVDVFELFNKSQSFREAIEHDSERTEEANKGRKEIRECRVLYGLNRLGEQDKWKNIQAVIHIRKTVKEDGQETIVERFFMSSLKKNVREFSRLIREHWKVESHH